MGSSITLNDTLCITSEQGFPNQLDIQRHLQNPYTLEDVADKIFTFRAKPGVRVYKIPPVRNFLAQEIGGKWIYWGLCLVESVQHDYLKRETSGTFRIIRLNSPEQMKQAFNVVDTRPELNYFSQ